MPAITYPANCRRSIRKLTDVLGVSDETAYAMILMTATLMDLRPDDSKVTMLVLQDCGIEEEKEDDIA